METKELVIFKFKDQRPLYTQWGFFGVSLDEFKRIQNLDHFAHYYPFKFSEINQEYVFENARKYMHELNTTKTEQINQNTLQYILDPEAREEDL